MKQFKIKDNLTRIPPREIKAYCVNADDYTRWTYCDTVVLGNRIKMIYKCEHCATGRPLSELEIEVEKK